MAKSDNRQLVKRHKAPPDQAEAALEAYNNVVRSAKMHDVRLVGYNFDVRPEYYGELLNPDRSSIRLSFDHSFNNISYSSQDKFLIGEVTWLVTGRVGRKAPLKIKATYLIVYRDVPDVGDENAAEFMRRVGKFAVYPYFRALVAQTSWESQTELPVLPVLR